MNDELVTLAEVAQAQGRKADVVRQDCDELNIHVAQDWAQRPAITVADARSLVSGAARRNAEQEQEWKVFLEASQAWDARREEACLRGAADAVARAHDRAGASAGFLRDLLGRPVRTPATPAQEHDARRSGWLHAGAQFERLHARPRFRGQADTVSVNLIYVDASEEGSLLAAAKGALTGPARPPVPPGVDVA